MSEDLKSKIRDIPDFPKEGIIFKDITTLLNDKDGFKSAISQLSDRYRDSNIDTIIGIEARGFIVGAALAYSLGIGFVPIRKPGKLPYKTFNQTYELEYGTDTIQIHQDAVKKGDRVVIADDLIATGGTVAAACELVNKMGAEIVELAFLIELSFLNGKDKLKGYELFSLMSY